MSLYDGVDIDGVPMQSKSTEGTDITKLCELIYAFGYILSLVLVVFNSRFSEFVRIKLL